MPSVSCHLNNYGHNDKSLEEIKFLCNINPKCYGFAYQSDGKGKQTYVYQSPYGKPSDCTRYENMKTYLKKIPENKEYTDFIQSTFDVYPNTSCNTTQAGDPYLTGGVGGLETELQYCADEPKCYGLSFTNKAPPTEWGTNQAFTFGIPYATAKKYCKYDPKFTTYAKK